MGVPGFVSWLRKNCKDVMILTTLQKNPKILYIDGNCLIHPKCFEVLSFDNATTNIKNIETIMFKRICKYIDFLVDFVNPEICYFAVDGVAPMSKINQQRKRRYKSIDDANMMNELKIKHKMKLDVKWSNTVITPGTDFMERLHEHLLEYFNNKKKLVDPIQRDPIQRDPIQRDPITYIYSSYHTPGEGEHKILEDIRKRLSVIGSNGNDVDDTYVIYGLDADLFFLAMASQKQNIYLLREEIHFVQGKVVKRKITDVIDDVIEEMRYVSIDITKECFNNIIRDMITKKMVIPAGKTYLDRKYMASNIYDDYWNDIVFICYFLGNDFLPHLPSIDVRIYGLDIVIDTYIDVYIKLNNRSEGLNIKLITVDTKNSVNNSLGNIDINNIFLLEILRELGEKETFYFTKILPEYNYYKQKRRCEAEDKYSREVWNIENMKFKVEDPIRLGWGHKNEWKFRYYDHYYGISEHYTDHVNNMVRAYIEGLKWITIYYYNKCPSWDWQYAFAHAPFISDIYEYMRTSDIDINKIVFHDSKPLTPYIQLLSVLPSSCTDIIPKKYVHLVTDSKSPIIDMFPVKVRLDMISKNMYWMCIPIIPYLDINRILDAVKNIKLSKTDNIKNKELKNFYF